MSKSLPLINPKILNYGHCTTVSDSDDQADSEEATFRRIGAREICSAWKVRLSHNTEELYADEEEACGLGGLGGSDISDTPVE